MNCDVRMDQVDLVNALRAHVERRLRFKLGPHAEHVRALKFRLTEQDGSGGNGTKLCLLTAKLAPSGEVTVTASSTDLYKVVSRAIERLKTALLRKIERRRDTRRRRESVRFANHDYADRWGQATGHPL
jgi:ribosome-associated translation inhibitor RaiA